MEPSKFSEIEKNCETVLPKHTYTVIRVDGKGFSKFTKEMRKDSPFNDEFSDRMKFAAKLMFEKIDGAFIGYVGSDEISIIIQDIPEKSEKWFGGRIQKIASLSASIASVGFNHGYESMAIFDARVFDLGDNFTEVIEYLQDRRGSVTKNSISMYASHFFSHKKMDGVSTRCRISALRENGTPWDAIPDRDRFGTLLFKEKVLKEIEFTRNGELNTIEVLRSEVHEISPTNSNSLDREYTR